jgi:serine/threonine protein kinase
MKEEETKYLGEGSYGCVVTPPIKCKKSKVKQANKGRKVGKLIRLKNAQVELSISELIKGIPGWERYFLIQEKDNCEPSNFKEYRETYQKQCKIIDKVSDKELGQLISPFGGKMLHSLALTESFNYLGSFRHMLEAVALLNRQGICHYDLHEGNILVDYNGTMRIIDYGAAFQGDQVSDESLWRHIYSFSPGYVAQPPEVSVRHGLLDSVPFAQAINTTIKDKKILEAITTVLGVKRETQWDDLYKFFREENTEDVVKFYHSYWRKWDSWSVGVIFLKLLQKSFLLQKFTREVWPVAGQAIRVVLKGLLEVDPRRRLTAEQALEIFRNVSL